MRVTFEKNEPHSFTDRVVVNKLWVWAQCLYRANQSAPSIAICGALTQSRQAIGWCGKNIEKSLQESRYYKVVISAQHSLYDVKWSKSKIHIPWLLSK